MYYFCFIHVHNNVYVGNVANPHFQNPSYLNVAPQVWDSSGLIFVKACLIPSAPTGAPSGFHVVDETEEVWCGIYGNI